MTTDSEKRAEIKQKRMKKAFVDTTKKMIVDKGFENVTVRDVADATGYTCVTLYKHFTNFEELFWQTREVIVSDIADYLLEKISDYDEGQIIKYTFKEYINYCVSKPNAFKFLFYFQQKNNKEDFSDNNYMASLITVFTNAFSQIADSKKLDAETVMKKSNTAFFAVHGILMVYLSNNFGMTSEVLHQYLDDAMKFILEEE